MKFDLFKVSPTEPENYRDWKRWFAWRPILTDGGVIVWLEYGTSPGWCLSTNIPCPIRLPSLGKKIQCDLI